MEFGLFIRGLAISITLIYNELDDIIKFISKHHPLISNNHRLNKTKHLINKLKY